MINKAVLTLTIACSASLAIAGHHEKGEKADHNSAAWQIKAYSSAAPDFLGDFATVIGSDGSVLRQGTNGWICQSANPRPVPATGWSSAHEAMPACHDGEGMKWMMGYMAGKAPELERDTYMWMLHGDMAKTTPRRACLMKPMPCLGNGLNRGPTSCSCLKIQLHWQTIPRISRRAHPMSCSPGRPMRI